MPPLTDDLIQECVDRYLREQDRYTKMAEITYEKCLDIVQKKLTIRATVQRRTKNARSFAEKLKKNSPKYESVDDVFKKISDLAAVRIATYLESDRKIVVDELKKEFLGSPHGDQLDIEVKGDNNSKTHYRATHCQIYLPEEDLSGNNENLKNTTCEIQVCSLLAHVFNEIEHDLQYKPLSGQLSNSEKEFIEQLGLLTKAGDIAIKRLLEANESRLKENTGEFSDVYDFVERMRKKLNLDKNFSSNAGQLFDELMKLNLKTPESISQAVTNDSSTFKETCIERFNNLKNYLSDKENNLLEENSSDILLVGILENKVEEIVLNHPTGRGLGRPSRLVRIATHYKNMREALINAPSE